MPSPYQDFLKQARERFQKNQERGRTGSFSLTRHAEFKMRQYNLSEQKIRSVIRNPKRREEGIVKDTVAVMQPVSPKRGPDGKETWKQEVWAMYQQKPQNSLKTKNFFGVERNIVTIISAWRYPGVSPLRNPIPADILREIEEGSILDREE